MPDSEQSKLEQLEQLLDLKNIFKKNLDPKFQDTEIISSGDSLYRYFSTHIIVKHFNNKICSPFCNIIEKNHLVINDNGIIENEVFCEELIKCFDSSIKYVVFHVTLRFSGFHHANIVIVDKSKQNYFIFEPHGFNDDDHSNYPNATKNKIFVHDKLFNFFKNKLPGNYIEARVSYSSIQFLELQTLSSDNEGRRIKLCLTHTLFFAFIFFNFVFNKITRPITNYDVPTNLEKLTHPLALPPDGAAMVEKYTPADATHELRRDEFDGEYKRDWHDNKDAGAEAARAAVQPYIDSYFSFMQYTGDAEDWIYRTLKVFNSIINIQIYSVFLERFNFYYIHYTYHDINAPALTRERKRKAILNDIWRRNLYESILEKPIIDDLNVTLATTRVQEAFNLISKKFADDYESIFTITGINFDLMHNNDDAIRRSDQEVMVEQANEIVPEISTRLLPSSLFEPQSGGKKLIGYFFSCPKQA